MNKEDLNPYQAQEKRIAFIEKAVAEGGLKRIKASERNQNIAIVYYLNNTEKGTGKNLGKIFREPSEKPLTRERVRQISENALMQFHIHASPELQACHPLEELLARKPNHFLEEKAYLISLLARNGVVDPIILMLSGYSRQDISRARKKLKKQGIEIPQFYTYFETKAMEAKNDNKELQRMLDSFPKFSLMEYIIWVRKNGGEEILTHLSSVLNEKGFHPPMSAYGKFATRIILNQIPIRYIKGRNYSCYFVFAIPEQKKQIVEALESDPDLQKFRKKI